MSVAPPALPALDPAMAARLERGAGLARVLAAELCRTRNGHDNCGALHGIWPLLRRVGLAAEPSRHDRFYRRILGDLADSGEASRVLVAGTADWGMLELIADVYRKRAARLDVTVVDRCPTPVLLNAWFGAEIGLPVRTATADLLRLSDDQPFDVICTHSLLGYPPPEMRAGLVANWFRLLRPGGAVVTVTRLSAQAPAPVPGPVDAPGRTQQFADELLARWRMLGLAGDPLDLHARAERFSLAQVHHPVGDAAAVRRLFEEQGFAVPVLDLLTIGAASATAQAVPGAARSGRYGEIVAVKS